MSDATEEVQKINQNLDIIAEQWTRSVCSYARLKDEYDRLKAEHDAALADLSKARQAAEPVAAVKTRGEEVANANVLPFDDIVMFGGRYGLKATFNVDYAVSTLRRWLKELVDAERREAFAEGEARGREQERERLAQLVEKDGTYATANYFALLIRDSAKS